MGLFCMHAAIPNHKNGVLLGYLASIKGNIKIFVDYKCSLDMQYLANMALGDIEYLFRQYETSRKRSKITVTPETLLPSCITMINKVESLYYKFENNEDINILDEDDLNILRDIHSELQSLRLFPQ